MKKNNKELKKTTKKVMAALLAVTMMGSTFAGCSAKKNDSTVEKKQLI